MQPLLVVIIAILVTLAIFFIADLICSQIAKGIKKQALFYLDQIKTKEEEIQRQIVVLINQSKVKNKFDDILDEIEKPEVKNLISKRNYLEFTLKLLIKYADSYNDNVTSKKAKELLNFNQSIYDDYNKKAISYNSLTRMSIIHFFKKKELLQIL